MGKYVEPSTTLTAFNCAHCGTLTTQTWCRTYADPYTKGDKIPPAYESNIFELIDKNDDWDLDQKEEWRRFCTRQIAGDLFLRKRDAGTSVWPDYDVANLSISICYECKDLTIWLDETMLYPSHRVGVEPNEDLDPEIKSDFEEARTILNLSPRGSAALLRLCVQKLCKQLGESGTSIDGDIAKLVAKGLSPMIQQALDSVRVIGNEAVHPGELDLRDDRDTALQLFELINVIADQQISLPKRVNKVYEKLPAAKRAWIEKRDGVKPEVKPKNS